MTVDKFQRVYSIQSITTDETEKVCLMLSEVFGLDYTELMLNEVKGVDKYIKRLNKKIETKQGLFSLKLITDAQKITLGQFIECQHWLKSDPILNLHLIAASILKKRKEHKLDADRILNVDIKRVHDKVYKFIESFRQLIESYSGLFEIEEDIEDKPKRRSQHIFPERYGWMFSAKEVADYEGVKLNDAYEINIIQALNTMSYLKSKASYEKWQSKQ